ncbi:hypothetical protein GCM10011344_35260 [Dokdonia pacifica]|uniref:eCIS core domain-containing protein n=1 Tax=Dokdonia pacifica TaxID=1627892 RepID=A0A239ARE2_9FLAO|nr:DUF4157 domain-containing protein [Dokdonia pacifica]GGG31300.1 hypothetical protein GCM10011344_35260 [Dokdonia pacifica]SNR97921.1 protein of unknown function [Dokdonia pacifica]
MSFHNHIQGKDKEANSSQETTIRDAGENGMFLEDNRPSTTIQQKTLSAVENSTSTLPIQKKENNTGLPDDLKSGIENLSGYAMDDVKVHYNSDKPTQLNAHAYAQGTDIHLASGQEKHLPHEAWHVVQQKQGRVQPTKQLKSKVNINDDEGLEKEADEMGEKALQLQSIDRIPNLQTVTISKNTTQRYIVPDAEVDGSFTSQVSRNKEGGGKTFLDDTGNGAQLETKETSKVRVAVTGKMAIEDSELGARQAKFFYADGDILQQANNAMEAINSPISFDMGSATITVHDENGLAHVLDLIVPIKNKGAEDQATGTNIRIPENCNEAACSITKLNGDQGGFHVKYNDNTNDINAPSGVLGRDLVPRLMRFLPAYLKDKNDYDASSYMSRAYNKMSSIFSTTDPSDEEQLMNTARDSSNESIYKIIGYDNKTKSTDPNMPDIIGQEYSEEFLNQPGANAIIDQLGINESAAPDAGDAMAIFSTGNSIKNEEGDGISVMDYRTGNYIDNPAPYHFATVIARSGADYITMENYVRQKEEASTDEPADSDPRYFFRMYGPEAQSFHSENVDRYPNAMTLALSKPVQQVAQLQSDAPIQFSDEEDTVKEVRGKMSDGPGNQTTSSKKAKESFAKASQLESLLLEQKNSMDSSTIDVQSMAYLGRDALYRKNFMTEEGDDEKMVSAHVAENTGGKNRADQLKKIRYTDFDFSNLIEIVWKDFVLRKTGGGSCDHISAATFLNLVDKGKSPVLISYEPKSDKDYEITPPSEEFNKHRSVLVKDMTEDKKPILKEIDPWFPEDGHVQIFESEKEASSKLKNVEIKWEWEPDDQEFVDAVQKELELRYQKLVEDKKLKEKGDADSITALWEIKKKEDEEI